MLPTRIGAIRNSRTGDAIMTRWPILALAACLAPCGTESSTKPEVSSVRQAGGATHYVRVYPDGTFIPQLLSIDRGDKVVWGGPIVQGVPGALETTDAISPIGEPLVNHTHEQICGTAPGGPHVSVFTNAPLVGNDSNFYGPKRKGISGIHVLGPQGYGKIETTLANCALLENPPDPDDENDVRYIETATAVDPAMVTHRLCSKLVKDALGNWRPSGDVGAGNISQIVPSVWANPDVDGVVLRIRWNDLQKYDLATNTIVTIWDDVDRELRKALETGKMVSIAIHAGEDTPDFIFKDFDPDPTVEGEPVPAASDVEPVWLKDYYDGSTIPDQCGAERRYGSPSDPKYLTKIKGLYDSLAWHLTEDARLFQALGYVKVTGLNLTTGEAMLPKRCLAPGASGQPGACWCNTQLWAEATYGYTPSALYTFYNEVEHEILGAFIGEKSLHYMLIQDGFPRVKDALNFFRDPGHPLGPMGSDYPGSVEQTEQVLEYARRGRFALPGDPAATLSDDLYTGKLFVTQHSGLQVLGADERSGGNPCKQTMEHTLSIDAHGKKVYSIYYNAGVVPGVGGDGAYNCPNDWAVEDGYRGQLIGFQNAAGILAPADIDSSLWNMTSASNAAYFEMYEEAAWGIGIRRGTGPTAAPLDDGTKNAASGSPYYYPSMGARFQKNLHEWSRQLHERRRAISATVLDVANQPYPNLADPFPPSHSHTFDDPVGPLTATPTSFYYYINPGKCLAAPSASRAYGVILVREP